MTIDKEFETAYGYIQNKIDDITNNLEYNDKLTEADKEKLYKEDKILHTILINLDELVRLKAERK